MAKKAGIPLTSYVLMILLVCFSFFAGYFFFKSKNLEQKLTTGTQQGQAQPQAPQAVTVTLDQIKKLFNTDHIIFGDVKRKVLFVEISDPSCPYCHIAGGQNPELSETAGNFKYVSEGGAYTPPLPEIKKLVDEKKASYVFLYGNGHGNGRLASEALYCAYEKGKFWEVHDQLMTNTGYSLINDEVQNNRDQAQKLVDFVSAQIDPNFLTECLTSAKHEKKLERDEQIDATLGFAGTPHFFVNETAVNGAQDWNAFKE